MQRFIITNKLHLQSDSFNLKFSLMETNKFLLLRKSNTKRCKQKTFSWRYVHSSLKASVQDNC